MFNWRPKTGASSPISRNGGGQFPQLASSASTPSLGNRSQNGRGRGSKPPKAQAGVPQSDRAYVKNSTVQGKDGTWQFIGRLDGAQELPNFRSEVVALEVQFGEAMAVVDNRTKQGGAAGFADVMDRTMEDGMVSPCESDYISMQGQIDAAFAQRKAITQAVSVSEGVGQAQLAALGDVDPTSKEALALEAKNGVNVQGLSKTTWSETQVTLTNCIYEQKWVDLTTSELSNQVAVGCLEQGRLIRDLRLRMASIFDRMCLLQSDGLWQLDAAIDELTECRVSVAEAELRRQEGEEKLHEEYAAKMEELRQGYEEAAAQQKEDQKEAQAQVDRMSETLRTLNGIFRDIQMDADMVKSADIKGQNDRLERELAEARAELAELRPLKEKAQRLMVADKLIVELREKSDKAAEELEEKNRLIATMLEDEAQRLADDEATTHSKKNENDRRADMHENKEAPATEAGAGAAEPVAAAAVEEDEDNGLTDEQMEAIGGGSNVLCVRCKKALDDLANIRVVVEGEKPPERLQCHAYRLLLPNLQGFRPSRPVAWIRLCMRSLVFAKLREQTIMGRYDTQRSRFPEFAYSWLEPDHGPFNEMDVAEQRKLVALADDDRWGLYYGVKALSKESVEARIFWSLLDESHGEDYNAFYLYCVETMTAVAGRRLRRQFGVAPGACNIGLVDEAVQVQPDGTTSEPIGSQSHIWVELQPALDVSQIVLASAVAETRHKVIDATRKIAVAAEGRLPGGLPNQMCVDIFLWLRVVMATYRSEQVNRRAAVRLMFETAVSGVIAVHVPIYGDGRAPSTASATTLTINSVEDDKEKKYHVDLPQFLSIVRTLWPRIELTEAVTFFREAHDHSEGEIDLEVFLEIADRRQFFTQSLELQPYVTAYKKPEGGLDASARNNLGAKVHLHVAMIRPLLAKMKQTMPSATRAMIENAEAMVYKSLEFSSSTSSSGMIGVDGLMPLAAYRRLLAFVLHERMLNYELAEGAYDHRMADEDLDGNCVVQYMEKEMEALELVAFDFALPTSFVTIQHLREKLAASRISLAWRRKLTNSCVPPVPMLRYMRPGYLAGRGAINSRRNYIQPCWVLSLVAEVYSQMLREANAAHVHGTPEKNLASMMHTVVLMHVGNTSVTDRVLQDFFFNMRNLRMSLPRIRLFASFMGLPDPEEGHAFAIFANPNALRYYLRIVCAISSTFHSWERADVPISSQVAGQKKGVLFPVTHTDNKKFDSWRAPPELLLKACEPILAEVYGKGSKESQLLLSVARQIAFDDGQSDVDEFLWTVMQQWAVLYHQCQIECTEAAERATQCFMIQSLGELEAAATTIQQRFREEMVDTDGDGVFSDLEIALHDEKRHRFRSHMFARAVSCVEPAGKRQVADANYDLNEYMGTAAPVDKLVAVRDSLMLNVLNGISTITALETDPASVAQDDYCTLQHLKLLWGMYEKPLSKYLKQAMTKAERMPDEPEEKGEEGGDGEASEAGSVATGVTGATGATSATGATGAHRNEAEAAAAAAAAAAAEARSKRAIISRIVDTQRRFLGLEVSMGELLVLEGTDAEKCMGKVPDLMVTIRGLVANFQQIIVLADGKPGLQPEFVRDTWASGKKFTPDRKPAFLSH